MGKSVTPSDASAMIFAPSFSADMNANRPLSVACVLSNFANVEVITTDFDHWTKTRKEKKQIAPIGKIVYLKTLPYYDNASVMRLISHLVFSFSAGVYFLRNRKRASIVYATLPFNTLAWFVLRNAGNRWKIADITDIWPDVLPFSFRLQKVFKPIFALWRKFFYEAVASADVMMAVSDSFFEETLKYVNANCQSHRFYLAEVGLLRDVPKNDLLTVAYSGNLGRLYDFETLLEVLSVRGAGTIQLVIVGDGDRREWLLEELSKREIPFRYFGSVYEPDRLGDILSRAHLGFNGFVNTSATFSTKASTYFSAGLPILNSMDGDLRDLVSERGLGFNYQGGDRTSLERCLAQIDREVLAKMSQNCIRFFASELERAKVREDMQCFLQRVLANEEQPHNGLPHGERKSNQHLRPKDLQT
jgi:glycosyltransferase involved in cell wall biosynthesis